MRVTGKYINLFLLIKFRKAAPVPVKNQHMKDVQKLEKEFEKVPHVQDVLWYDDVTDISLPTEMIPKDDGSTKR